MNEMLQQRKNDKSSIFYLHWNVPEGMLKDPSLLVQRYLEVAISSRSQSEKQFLFAGTDHDGYRNRNFDTKGGM
jgi:hypothetical protein